MRVFWNPTRSWPTRWRRTRSSSTVAPGGFRHQSIVDTEAMFQKLGAENGFDVDIWDPNINQGPVGRLPRASR